MEIFNSEDKTVTKIIHEDKSETAIKLISGCSTCEEKDRNKYSIFVSSSYGCQFNCKFCYLTLKQIPYKSLTKTAIINNLKEAITYKLEQEPSLSKKYAKICWMGMGDAFVKTDKVTAVTESSLNYILERGLAVGLDGVDLSTVMPKVKNVDETFEHLKNLEHKLQEYPLNPHSDILVHRDKEFSNMGATYPDRSRFRLFYSLHSAIQESRDKLSPNAMALDEAIPALLKYSENNKYNVIFHHMFMDGFNDTEEEINALIELI